MRVAIEEGLRKSKAGYQYPLAQACRESRIEFLRHHKLSIPDFMTKPSDLHDNDNTTNIPPWGQGGPRGDPAWVSVIYRHTKGDVVMRVHNWNWWYLHCLNYWDNEAMKSHTSTLKIVESNNWDLEGSADTAGQLYCDWKM